MYFEHVLAILSFKFVLKINRERNERKISRTFCVLDIVYSLHLVDPLRSPAILVTRGLFLVTLLCLRACESAVENSVLDMFSKPDILNE